MRQGTMTPAFFALLMRDAGNLLRPKPLVSISAAADSSTPFADHPNINTLLALSDVSALFASRKSSTPNAVTAKLRFYAARIVDTPGYLLTALANEAITRAKLVEREDRLNKTNTSTETQSTRATKPTIEELT